jgi:hypothetical protein
MQREKVIKAFEKWMEAMRENSGGFAEVEDIEKEGKHASTIRDESNL